MARIRSIKPDFFTSEKIAALPLSARLLFIGLWTHVDDNGVAPDNEKLINAAIWPLEDDPRESLQRTREDLRRLSTARLIVRYEAHGKALLFILNWDEHQKVSHPAKPRYGRPTPEQIRSFFGVVTSENDTSREEDVDSSRESPEDLGSPPEILAPEQGAGSREKGAGSREQGEDSSSEASPLDAPSRLDVERLCNHLADRIEANGSKKPTVTKKWRDAARLLMDTDGKSEQQVRNMIDWCQTHEFWRAHILSMPKLREKYDQMRLQAGPGQNRASKSPSPGANPQQFTKEDYLAGW